MDFFETNFAGKPLTCHVRCQGEKLMVGFHGFADTYEAFDAMLPILEGKYTLVTFDLPFHGEHLREDSFVYQVEDLVSLINQIQAKTGLLRLSMIGHSMGGRLIFNLLQYFEGKIDSLILLTPAGLTKRWFANPYLMPPFIIRAIKSFYLNREGTPMVYQLGRKLGLSTKASFDFMEKQFTNHRRRARLFNTWLSLYHFPIIPQKFKAEIKRQCIPTKLVMGIHDRIIHTKEATAFCGNNAEMIEIVEVPLGHFLLKKELLGHLR